MKQKPISLYANMHVRVDYFQKNVKKKKKKKKKFNIQKESPSKNN